MFLASVINKNLQILEALKWIGIGVEVSIYNFTAWLSVLWESVIEPNFLSLKSFI